MPTRPIVAPLEGQPRTDRRRRPSNPSGAETGLYHGAAVARPGAETSPNARGAESTMTAVVGPPAAPNTGGAARDASPGFADA